MCADGLGCDGVCEGAPHRVDGDGARHPTAAADARSVRLSKQSEGMLIRCSTCGRRISPRWLFLGLPWSSYRCEGCGSVFEGTILRFALTSIAVGVLGILVISVIKGRATAVTLILPVIAVLALFLLPLPGQLRRKG